MEFFLRNFKHEDLYLVLYCSGFVLMICRWQWNKIFFYLLTKSLLFQSDHVKDIKKQLHQDFANICKWFVGKKLGVHFGEDKTKSILLPSKQKIKMVPKLVIIYKNIIKQHLLVTYLVCILDKSIFMKSMARKVIRKINGRLKKTFPWEFEILGWPPF